MTLENVPSYPLVHLPLPLSPEWPASSLSPPSLHPPPFFSSLPPPQHLQAFLP